MTNENPYIFGDPAQDRFRLEAQTRMIGEHLATNAARLVGAPVTSILDVGCGEGQLGRVLRTVYPTARLVGIDKDPQAIATARAQAAAAGLDNTEYVVGDIQEGLPDGPFDLVFASLILIHTPHPERVLAHAYRVLQPGGCLLIKDLDLILRTAVDHPAYLRLIGMFFDTLGAIGAHPQIGAELPALLDEAGFVDSAYELEYYPLGGTTREGQQMLAALLGAFYGARGLMGRMQGVPEHEIMQMYADIANTAMGQSGDMGGLPLFNRTARRPRQDAAATPGPVA